MHVSFRLPHHAFSCKLTTYILNIHYTLFNEQKLDNTSNAKWSEKVFARHGSGIATDADRSGQTDTVVQQPSSAELRLCELS